MIGFTKMNLRTKKFSSEATNFKPTIKIPTKPNETVIYTGNGNNIHPTLWNPNWFEDVDTAQSYINKIRNSYKSN